MSGKLITHNTCQNNLVAITSATVICHLPHFVYMTCGHGIYHGGIHSSATLWNNICHTHHWHNICQHKPMTPTSAIAYMVYHLSKCVSVKITVHTNTNSLRCWKLLNITFFSDLRKACLHGEYFCFWENIEPNSTPTLN